MFNISEKEMQFRTTVKYCLTLALITIMKKATKNKGWRGCGGREPSYTVGGKVNWYSHYGEEYRGSLK